MLLIHGPGLGLVNGFFSIEGMCLVHEGTKGYGLETCLHSGLECVRGTSGALKCCE